MMPNPAIAAPIDKSEHFGHPYGQPLIGICEVSARYFHPAGNVLDPLSVLLFAYHFSDGIVQSCRWTTYAESYTTGPPPTLHATKTVYTWERPFRPERGDFATSLRSCQRRYTSTDQIFLIPRAQRGGAVTSPKPDSTSVRKEDGRAQADPQLTLPLPTLEVVRGYRKY